MMQTVPRRRWFQVSLAEWLILTTLLGVAWWQCAMWPAADVLPFVTTSHVFWSEFGEVAGDSTYTSVGPFCFQRSPTSSEVAIRGAISSAAIIGVWLVGSIAIRAVIRRRPARHS